MTVPNFIKIFLVVTLVMLVASLPAAPAKAQVANPPHLFYGLLGNLTIDDSFYDGVTPIEVINSTGEVVTLAAVSGAYWTVQVPSTTGPIQIRIGTAVSGVMPVEIGQISGSLVLSLVSPEVSIPKRNVLLSIGTNMIAYSGSSAVSPSAIKEALADPSALETIFYWDGSSQNWLSWRPSAPSFLNDLTSITPNMPLSLMLTKPTTIEMGTPNFGSGTVQLVTGYTTVTFLGDDSTSLSDAMGDIGALSRVEAVFWLNPVTGTYKSYRPGGPVFLNDLVTLNRYDVVFVKCNGETDWSH